MGLVVPAKKIIDLIEGDPVLREARDGGSENNQNRLSDEALTARTVEGRPPHPHTR